ncbi:MAG: hypothetical protein IBX68_11555 [Dehalococcoidia bacterium]|nr:hypothetical protein [Dehalococcoidia bacterium]
MFARVSTIVGRPDRVDDAARYLGEEMRPTGLEEMKGAYLLANRKSGKLLTITLWETEEAVDASASAARGVRDEAARIAGADPSTVEVDKYEVTLQPSEIMR